MLKRYYISILVLFVSFVSQGKQLDILVTIPPQAYLIKQISNDYHNIAVLIEQNQNPHNFELTPKKLKTISNVDIYFTIHLPLEKAVISKLINVNPAMNVIEAPLFESIRNSSEEEIEEHHDHHNHSEDAHYWMDPVFMRDHAQNIAQSLCIYDPLNTIEYLSNYLTLQYTIDSLITTLSQQFTALNQKSIFVYHPAFGHFCERFGLTQIAVETDGKEPGPKRLAELINQAKELEFKAIFSQKQYPTKAVNILAKTLNTEVIWVEPLEEDYIGNLNKISQYILDMENTE